MFDEHFGGQDRWPYEKVPYKALKCSYICLQLFGCSESWNRWAYNSFERTWRKGFLSTHWDQKCSKLNCAISLNSIILANTHQYQTSYKFKFRPAITLAARDKPNRLQADPKSTVRELSESFILLKLFSYQLKAIIIG